MVPPISLHQCGQRHVLLIDWFSEISKSIGGSTYKIFRCNPPPPPGSNSFIFTYFHRKVPASEVQTPPPKVGPCPLQEILDPPLKCNQKGLQWHISVSGRKENRSVGTRAHSAFWHTLIEKQLILDDLYLKAHSFC